MLSPESANSAITSGLAPAASTAAPPLLVAYRGRQTHGSVSIFSGDGLEAGRPLAAAT